MLAQALAVIRDHAGGKLTKHQYINGFMKASDFPVPAAGTNGKLGRNRFRGPGFASVDFSLFKDFPTPWFTPEGSRIQFRTEIFNLFNRVNLVRPSSNLASAVFGKSNLAFSGRQMQFTLKLLF